MWSGPRNVSTAMMRAFGNRPDTVVCDEPLYAHYLVRTGRRHPGASEIIAHQENDWRKVADMLTGPLPPGTSVFFQKHMAHHLLPEIEGEWLDRLTHCFLIREPKAMLLSLDRILDEIDLEDTGLPQQVRIFERMRTGLGAEPPVVDARELLEAPRDVLAELCRRTDLEFDEAMLSWPPGRRPTDGVWAVHWYGNVEKSTGFEPFRPKDEALPAHLEELHALCVPLYERLHEHRIQPRK